MTMRDPDRTAAGGQVQHDLRQRVGSLLLDNADAIAADAAATFSYTGADEALDEAYCTRLGRVLLHALVFAVREARLDARGGFVGDLRRTVLERGVSISRLCTFAYLIERAAVDEIALDESLGATSEPWPLVAQFIRRASFDMLGAYSEGRQMEPAGAALVDRLTTVHTRAVLDVVLAKEAERACRYGYPLALMLFDVDDLSAINRDHGYGVGDRILEHLGTLIRTYFRQHDWVARHSEDSIAVLLTRMDADHAVDLSERVRSTVQERLGSVDHRTDRRLSVTVSAAVVTVRPSVGDVIDPERLVAEAEAALARAKAQGPNRVEHADGYVTVRRAGSAVPGQPYSSS
jgi:diguanylate cyclase (GGDEF)-like protein